MQLFQLTGKDGVDESKYDAALIAISDITTSDFVTGATLFTSKNALAIATKIEEYENNVENLRALIRDKPHSEYSTDNEIESIKSMDKAESQSSSYMDARISVITVSFAQN